MILDRSARQVNEGKRLCQLFAAKKVRVGSRQRPLRTGLTGSQTSRAKTNRGMLSDGKNLPLRIALLLWISDRDAVQYRFVHSVESQKTV